MSTTSLRPGYFTQKLLSVGIKHPRQVMSDVERHTHQRRSLRLYQRRHRPGGYPDGVWWWKAVEKTTT